MFTLKFHSLLSTQSIKFKYILPINLFNVECIVMVLLICFCKQRTKFGDESLQFVGFVSRSDLESWRKKWVNKNLSLVKPATYGLGVSGFVDLSIVLEPFTVRAGISCEKPLSLPYLCLNVWHRAQVWNLFNSRYSRNNS